MAEYSKWEEVKARRAESDPRSEAERLAARIGSKAKLEAYVRGRQLAEMRRAMQLTQKEVAAKLGVSQARVSKIESGEAAGIEVVRDYVSAVGGRVEVTATIGDRSWTVALPI